MKKGQRSWFIGGAAIIVVAIGVFVGLMLSQSDDTSEAVTNGQGTVEVSRGDIMQSLTVYGEVVPKQEYTYTFNGDSVNEILVSVGQRVNPDQVLITLESRQLELAMLQAKRALQEAQAEGIPAVIREKELSYQIAQDNYHEATLSAPFAGVVAEIHQAKTSSESWSISLIDTSELYVDANVDQLDSPKLSVGQTAEALIEPLPNSKWPVEIVEVGGMAESIGNTTVVVVTGKLLNPDPSILVGYTAEMEIITAHATDVLILPITCLTEKLRGWLVMKIADDKQTPQPVTIGAMSDQYVEIQSGLEEGDVVLLNSAIQPQDREKNVDDWGEKMQSPGEFLRKP